MRPVSPRFLSTLTGSHAMVSRAYVVEPGQTGVNPDGIELDIIGGDVQLAAAAPIRSNLQLTVKSQWPSTADSPLVPYGNEIFVQRGLSYGGGSFELVSFGYFRINLVEQDAPPDGPVRVMATDRMSKIIDAKLTEIATFSASQTLGFVVSELIADADLATVVEWDDETWTETLGRAVQVETDRHAFIDELLTSHGKVWYYDHRGILTIKSPPDSRLPLWSSARGKHGVLVSAGRSLSREGVYNGVLATGEGLDTEAPVRGLAVDDDPTSPTRWGGPFGKVPREYASPLLKTDEQAQLAAGTILRRSLGLPYNVEFQSVVNPALEPDDPIAVGLEGEPKPVIPALLVGDSFSRTVVNDMGTSESGHLWVTAGTTSTYQVNGGVLKKDIVTPGDAHNVLLAAPVGRTNVDLRAKFRVPVAATGGSLPAGLSMRRAPDGSHDSMRIEFNAGGTVSLKNEYAVLPDFDAYTAGQWWHLRAAVIGSLRLLKAWPDGDAEPHAWTLQAESEVNVSGTRFGLWFWKVGSNTNAVAPLWEVDNFQAFTAEAEVLRGGEIHVIDTLTIPLTAAAALSGTTRQQSLGVIELTS
jgi:hypothetical protein